MSAYYYQDTNGYNGMQQGGGYPQQNSVGDYMVPEEEWEREAVLDPAWERQQKKVSHRAALWKCETRSCLFLLDIHCLV